jgi:hypothetical protein
MLERWLQGLRLTSMDTPLRRSRYSFVIRRPFLTALAIASFLLTSTPAVAQVQIDWHAEVCGTQYRSAIITLGNVPLPNGDPFHLDRAMTLFRFNRQKESLAMLDAAVRKVRSPWRWRLPDDMRKTVTHDIDAFRNCVAKTRPAPLGTLTVRTRAYTEQGPQEPIPQMTVWVDAIVIGRTARNGTITARVPSGVIRLTAERSPSWWGQKHVTIRPGQSATVSIDIADGREGGEETPLVLAEAVDDIVPAATKSFTLKFMREGRLVPVIDIEHIELDDPDARSMPNLIELFTVAQGAIVARNTSALFDALAADMDRTISLLVGATDSAERFYGNRIAFRVGRSGLDVTLLAPPSNPQLGVASIEVGVSLMGAGIAVERVSDTNGRIRIQSFPHGPIALDCVTIAGGRYYYGQAMLVHSGERAVNLVLRHVSDLINGVPALANDGPSASQIPGTSPSAAAGEATEVIIDVTSRGRDETISRASTLIAPRGTPIALLHYEVGTAEHRSASGFDDLWALSVLGAAGERLFHIVRNVSSQVHFHPQWQSDSTTYSGDRIDIEQLTAEGPAHLTLIGTAINAGDAQHSTTVRARLSASSR